MNILKTGSFVFLGLIVGCAGAAVAPGLVGGAAHANAPAGKWLCAVADRLPNVAGARDWSGSKDIEVELNTFASHVSKGEILAINPKGGDYSDVICVKN